MKTAIIIALCFVVVYLTIKNVKLFNEILELQHDKRNLLRTNRRLNSINKTLHRRIDRLIIHRNDTRS